MNLYKLGQIVTLKSHPLLHSLLVKGDDRYIPPFMVISEILFENYKKKIFDDTHGLKISDNIKYKCLYFNDNKSEFNELVVYETMLSPIKKAKFHNNDYENLTTEREKLIDEIEQYKYSEYEYGKEVNFKTIKLEIFKKRKSKEILLKNNSLEEEKEKITYVVSFSSPTLIICGYKKEMPNNLFYPNGKPKLICSTEFFKIKWFNPFQQKFSEYFLPKECLIDKLDFS